MTFKPIANTLRAALAVMPLLLSGFAPAAEPTPSPAVQTSSAATVAPTAMPAATPAATTPAATPSPATPPPATPPDTKGLDEQIQALKKDAVDLNRELFMLEEELLFPANTQVAVFLSMDVGEFFALDSVQLRIDGHEVANYLYTPKEADALLKGGVQRLYLGNLKVGEHELVALFNGKGPNERDYRRGATLHFKKAVGAKYLELKINDKQRKLQPEFEIKDWE